LISTLAGDAEDVKPKGGENSQLPGAVTQLGTSLAEMDVKNLWWRTVSVPCLETRLGVSRHTAHACDAYRGRLDRVCSRMSVA
jgi:hypothetical protein